MKHTETSRNKRLSNCIGLITWRSLVQIQALHPMFMRDSVSWLLCIEFSLQPYCNLSGKNFSKYIQCGDICMLLFKQGGFLSKLVNRVTDSIKWLTPNICLCVVYELWKFSVVKFLQLVVVFASYVTIVTVIKNAFYPA